MLRTTAFGSSARMRPARTTGRYPATETKNDKYFYNNNNNKENVDVNIMRGVDRMAKMTTGRYKQGPTNRPSSSSRSSSRSSSSTSTQWPTIIVEQAEYSQRGEIRYVRKRPLGKGGFAMCFEVQQQCDGTKYAAKVIDKRTLEREATRRKLKSEIKIHGALSHRHVVKFVRYFEDRDFVYILLEICKCRVRRLSLSFFNRLLGDSVLTSCLLDFHLF